MLTLRLKPILEQRLEELARRTGRTKTFYAARALEQLLPEFEKTYEPIPRAVRDESKVSSAIAALKELRKGSSKPDGMSVREMIEAGRA